MDKNKYTAELVLRKTADGKVQCACEGSLADQKDLLAYYISKIAKALGLDEIEDLVDDIGIAAGGYLDEPDGENAVYEVTTIEPEDKDESQSEKNETQTDCGHCKKEATCYYKDIYPKGCDNFRPKEVVINE